MFFVPSSYEVMNSGAKVAEPERYAIFIDHMVPADRAGDIELLLPPPSVTLPLDPNNTTVERARTRIKQLRKSAKIVPEQS